MNFRRQWCIFQNSLPYKSLTFRVFCNKDFNFFIGSERIRRIVTAITVVPKEARVPFGFNCWQSFLPSSEEIFITGNSLCASKSLLSHWLPATQTLRLPNLIHILPFKLLSILHVHSWHSALSLRLSEVHGLWMSWQFPLFFFEFVDQPLWKHSMLF